MLQVAKPQTAAKAGAHAMTCPHCGYPQTERWEGVFDCDSIKDGEQSPACRVRELEAGVRKLLEQWREKARKSNLLVHMNLHAICEEIEALLK